MSVPQIVAHPSRIPMLPLHDRIALIDEHLRVERGIVDVASNALAQHAFARSADELHPTSSARLTGGIRAVYRRLFTSWRTKAMDRAVVQAMDVIANEAGPLTQAFAAMSPDARYRVAQILVARSLAAYSDTLEEERSFLPGPLLEVLQGVEQEQRMVRR